MQSNEVLQQNLAMRIYPAPQSADMHDEAMQYLIGPASIGSELRGE